MSQSIPTWNELKFIFIVHSHGVKFSKLVQYWVECLLTNLPKQLLTFCSTINLDEKNWWNSYIPTMDEKAYECMKFLKNEKKICLENKNRNKIPTIWQVWVSVEFIISQSLGSILNKNKRGGGLDWTPLPSYFEHVFVLGLGRFTRELWALNNGNWNLGSL